MVIFGGGRLVLRRHAAHGIGDHTVDKLKAVIGALAILACGEAAGEQGFVEKIAGEIPGEGPAGTIGAAQTWRQPDNQKPWSGRSEREQAN